RKYPHDCPLFECGSRGRARLKPPASEPGVALMLHAGSTASHRGLPHSSSPMFTRRSLRLVPKAGESADVDCPAELDRGRPLRSLAWLMLLTRRATSSVKWQINGRRPSAIVTAEARLGTV